MSVTVECPCGQEFERPIQRGRPQVWCPTCKALPAAERVERTLRDEDGEPVEHRVSRYGDDDPMTYTQREIIEAGVAEVNLDYATRIVPNKEKLFADTKHMMWDGTPDYGRCCLEWLHVAVYKVYHSVDPKTYSKGYLIGLPWEIV